MKTTLMVSVYVLCFASPSLSQDTLARYIKSDIGFNTTFFLSNLFQSSSEPFSIMYKKYKGPYNAYRFGIDTFLSTRDGSGTGSYNNLTSFSISVVLGKEKQNRLWKTWVCYYGLDVVPSVSHTKSANYTNDQKNQETETTFYRLAGRPFLGIRFDINRRLYISSETNLTLAFSHRKNLQKSFNPEQTTVDSSSNEINLNLSPASGIFVYYRF